MNHAEEPRWLSREEVDALHFELIRSYGGDYGIRDDNLIESAISRPLHKWHYEQANFSVLSAAYGYGLARNHGYVDGNKRIALAAMDTFLLHNSRELDIMPEEAVRVVQSVAKGQLSEEELGEWVEGVIKHSDP